MTVGKLFHLIGPQVPHLLNGVSIVLFLKVVWSMKWDDEGEVLITEVGSRGFFVEK